MIRSTFRIWAAALVAGLALGPATAAEPAAGIALPSVACDLLTDRAGAATRAAPSVAAAGPVPATAPAIRQVSGRGVAVATATAGFQRVALRTGALPAAMELGPRNLTVTPGTTALVEVAIGHLNRIVTPFATPVVHTVSSASTSVDGRVVYVATSGEEPIALWITDGQGGEHALSLTLAPRYVPPREIRVSVPGYRAPTGGAGQTTVPSAAALSERPASGDGFGAASYVEDLTELLRAMAQQRLPAGFQSGTATLAARCAANLKVDKTQLTEGASLRVLALGVRNTGSATIVIDESACDVAQHVVAAMAAWPRKSLAPGQETEIFLVLQAGAGAVGAGARPR